MYGLSGKLWNLLLPFLYITQIHVFSIGQETMAVDKIFQPIGGTKLKLQKGHEVVFRLF